MPVAARALLLVLPVLAAACPQTAEPGTDTGFSERGETVMTSDIDTDAITDNRDSAAAELPDDGTRRFPEGFLLGTSTAGFQVEMGCPTMASAQCRDANSDWYAYVTSPEAKALGHTYITGEDPAVVCPGFWELFPDDFDRAAGELHNDAFRLGIEWSRVFPASTEGIEGYEALKKVANPDALATYHAMFQALRARGLKPLVTIYHYSLPVWIHDGARCTVDFEHCTDRGWLDPGRIVPEIAKYAGFVAREFGVEVDLWATQNEPFAVIVSGFLYPSDPRSNPPARLFDAAGAKTALVAMARAHAAMYDAVHDGDADDADGDGQAAEVGLVYAMAPTLPRDPQSALDVAAARNIFYLWNLLFLDAVAAGRLDDDLDGVAQDDASLKGRMDFLGLNYYVGMRVEGMEASILPELSPLFTMNPLTIDTSLLIPRGLYEILDLLSVRYGRPVYITENNGQEQWFGGGEAAEVRVIVQNWQWLLHAIAQGVDVRGYFYWSLLDNYEWNHGMDLPTGLYAVDPHDPAKKRTARERANVYGALCAARGVTPGLAAKAPVDLDEAPTGGIPQEFRVPAAQ